MNGFLRLILIISLSLSLVQCTTSREESASGESNMSQEDFEDFDSNAAAQESADTSAEDSVENELDLAEDQPAAPAESTAQASPEAADEFSEFEEGQPPAAQEEKVVDLPPAADEPMNEPTIEPPPPEIAEETAPPIVETMPPPVEEPLPEQDQPTKITNIKYRANDNGGTVVVESSAPLAFDTRSNPDTNQFIIEIPNAELPAKLKRPFNTKDMKGGIGSIDAYQNKGSTTARIVVQLRAGATEPTVQAEGNSLLIVQSGTATPDDGSQGAAIISSEPGAEGEDSAEGDPQTQLLSASSLEEFISGNTKFYGKKISLEVAEMDVREVFRLIGEESGINLVVSDEVKGTISLKLRQVPWDQALVVILKARKLGYTRAGNILRIAPIADLRTEEEDSLKLANTRKTQAALTVRVLPISYAKIEDLVNQVKNFLSERGKVVGDLRTSSIIVSDLEENIERVSKLIASIDQPPMQVLIEGKVVEASEEFQRNVGINWNARLPAGEVGRNSVGNAVRASNGVFSVSPALSESPTTGLRFNLGTLDILGDLSATLALFEQQQSVKILSSPRIVTIHNEQASISQVTQIPLRKVTLVPGSGTVETTEFKPIELKLVVTPQITNDASVILGVEVNRDIAASEAGAVDSRNAKTKVMVRNGQTAVIGGIYQSDTSNVERRTPWVGEIPVVGWLFKSKGTQDKKNELLIFLTPRIIGQTNSQTIAPQIQGDN